MREGAFRPVPVVIESPLAAELVSPRPSKRPVFLLAALTCGAMVLALLGPVLPTSSCKGFYIAQRGLAPGMPLAAAHAALRPFDGGPPFAAADTALSFRCQSDAATVDYAIVEFTPDLTIASVEYLLD